MDGAASVNEVIDTFAPLGKIFYVHFRDVIGTVPRFTECFLGEGNINPVEVIRRLDANGFDGFVIDDHVPAMVGDLDTWADTTPEAYVSAEPPNGYVLGLADVPASGLSVRGFAG